MNQPLQKSFSLIFYAFRITSDWNDLISLANQKETIWKKSSVTVKEQFLLPHVHKYFNHNSLIPIEEFEKLDVSQGIIFELKPALKATRAKASFEKILTTPLTLKIRDQSYDFHFHDGSKQGLTSPKLILIPQSSVGLLSFSFCLEEGESTISDLINFNYACRALYASTKTAAKIFPREENINPQIAQIFHAVYSEQKEGAIPFFNLNQLVKFFLADFNPTELQPISPKRFHIFSFVQTQTQLDAQELNESIFRISRVYNNNYHPSFDSVAENDEVRQTFRDVYMAISPEGGSVFINTNKSDEVAFFKNYGDSIIKNRYLWIYFMAYLQRISLINTAYTISNLLEDDSYSISLVSKKIQLISKIQIRSMFSEISHIKMHNAFYALCRDSFKIPALFNELKDELFDLNMIVQQDHEIKRIQAEVENKERDKKLELERRAIEEQQAKFEGRLNLILFGLGILTFLSVWKDFADLMLEGISREEWISLGQLSISVTIIILIVYIIKRFLKK